jgi:hypothetical protein
MREESILVAYAFNWRRAPRPDGQVTSNIRLRAEIIPFGIQVTHGIEPQTRDFSSVVIARNTLHSTIDQPTIHIPRYTSQTWKEFRHQLCRKPWRAMS